MYANILFVSIFTKKHIEMYVRSHSCLFIVSSIFQTSFLLVVSVVALKIYVQFYLAIINKLYFVSYFRVWIILFRKINIRFLMQKNLYAQMEEQLDATSSTCFTTVSTSANLVLSTIDDYILWGEIVLSLQRK